jgi:hypothetical protein
MRNMATEFSNGSKLTKSSRTDRLRRWVLTGRERSDLVTALFVLLTALGTRWLAKELYHTLGVSYPIAFAAGFAVVVLLASIVCGTGKFTLKATLVLIGIASVCIYVVGRYLGV